MIGSLASGFLELPEERIMNLEKVVKLVDTEQHTLIEMRLGGMNYYFYFFFIQKLK